MKKYLLCCTLFILTACQSLPQIFQSVENMADNNAVELTMSKDTMKKDINVNITMQGKQK